MKFLSPGNFGFFIGDNDFVVTFEVNLGRIHKKVRAKEAGKAVSLRESSGGIREAFVADAERSGTLRVEDAVSGWNDPRDLRSTGFYSQIGSADPETEGEPDALPWGVYSGRPALHPFGASLRLFKIVPDDFVRRTAAGENK